MVTRVVSTRTVSPSPMSTGPSASGVGWLLASEFPVETFPVSTGRRGWTVGAVSSGRELSSRDGTLTGCATRRGRDCASTDCVIEKQSEKSSKTVKDFLISVRLHKVRRTSSVMFRQSS